MQRKVISQEEARAKTTAWALTFADLTTLLLTFFVLLLVILNDAEAHVDRLVNIILDETERELKPLQQNNLVEIERVTKGIKITLTGSKLFKSLSADLNPEADPILVQIGGLIRTSTLMNIYKQKRWLPLLNRISIKSIQNHQRTCYSLISKLKLGFTYNTSLILKLGFLKVS